MYYMAVTVTFALMTKCLASNWKVTEKDTYICTDVHIRHDVARSLLDCTMRCSKTPFCYQVNYHDTNHTCELLPWTLSTEKEELAGWSSSRPYGDGESIKSSLESIL